MRHKPEMTLDDSDSDRSSTWRPNPISDVQYTEVTANGEYYVLGDGTCMKAEIGRERIIPQWVTKAGKPASKR